MDTGKRLLGACAAAAALAAGPGVRAETLVANSPFAPSGVAVAAANQRGEAYELSGASSDGAKVNVCIYEREHKHSQWIPVGALVDGIRVVSYDSGRDTAMVIIGGIQRQLVMRKATAGARAPAIAARQEPVVTTSAPPAPVASAPAPSLTAAAQDQREARMLVSDLLEIGAQQRKAYQEAKQKEASGAAPSQQN